MDYNYPINTPSISDNGDQTGFNVKAKMDFIVSEEREAKVTAGFNIGRIFINDWETCIDDLDHVFGKITVASYNLE